MSKFWIPQFKWQLVQWLEQAYPSKKWEGKTKKQLMAIYINCRKKGLPLKEGVIVQDQGNPMFSPSITHVTNHSTYFCSRPKGC